MKTIHITMLLMGLSFASGLAQESCLNSEQLLSLDASWEKALLESDVAHLNSLLSENFIWVHNHASMSDNKAAVVKRAEAQKAAAGNNTRSRISKDVEVFVNGSTAIVTGFTVVDRDARPTNYHFMRTYVEIEGKCFLMANHTMAVPEKEE